MNKLLVIGSNSFSGQNLISHALERDIEVYGMSRSEEKSQVELAYDKEHFNYQFIQCDINNHREVLEIFNFMRPNYIVNFAAQSEVAHSWKQPEDWIDTNVKAVTHLADLLKDSKYLKKFIHSSTPEIYGSTTDDMRENDWKYNPSTPYAVSKAAGDLMLKCYHNQYGFPVIFTRVGNIYGPRQQLYKIIPKTIFSILTGNKIPLHGGGKSMRAFIHCDDASRAVLNLLQNGKVGETYHISNDSRRSIERVVGIICYEMGVNFEDYVELSEDRRGKDGMYSLNSDKMKSLGWESKVDISEGIQDTMTWIRNNLDFLVKYGKLNYEHAK